MFIHLVCYLYWSGVDIIREESAEHAAVAGPYGPVMDLGAAGKGGKGVGGGLPVKERNEKYWHEVEVPVNGMTLPGTLFQSEHENAHAMTDVHIEIPAHENARAMSDTRDTMLAHEAISTYARLTGHKLHQMSHPETGFMSNDESQHESPRNLP